MIYFDNNATTPLSDAVSDSIKQNLKLFQNPSSLYKEANEIKSKIKKARKSVGMLIGAPAENIIFTGCATESNNTVINTCIDYYKRGHIIVSSVEHSAILETVKTCELTRDISVTYLPVDEEGNINIEDIRQSIREDTILVSIMLANNEIGNIYPLKEIVETVNMLNPKTKVHTDAVQAIGKMSVNVEDLGVDFLSLSAHKFYAPKGVGALYVKDMASFIPFMRGGHQENGRRAGTENSVSIIAMGVAAEETANFTEYNRLSEIRNYLENKISRQVIGSKIIGNIDNRICNTSCIMIDGFSGVDICDMVNKIGDICISSGSACNSIETEASHVMKAMGYSAIPIRISMGRQSTKEEVDLFCQTLLLALNQLRRRKK